MSIIVTAADKIKAILEASAPIAASHSSGMRQFCNALCVSLGMDYVPEVRVLHKANPSHWKGFTLPKQKVLVFDPATFHEDFLFVQPMLAEKIGQLVSWREGKPLKLVNRRAHSVAALLMQDDTAELSGYVVAATPKDALEALWDDTDIAGALRRLRQIVFMTTTEKQNMMMQRWIEREQSPGMKERVERSVREYNLLWKTAEEIAERFTNGTGTSAQDELDQKILRAQLMQRSAIDPKLSRY